MNSMFFSFVFAYGFISFRFVLFCHFLSYWSSACHDFHFVRFFFFFKRKIEKEKTSSWVRRKMGYLRGVGGGEMIKCMKNSN